MRASGASSQLRLGLPSRYPHLASPTAAGEGLWPLLLLPVLLVIVGLLGTVLWLSFLRGLPGTREAHFTLANYVSLYADPFSVTALTNTLGFALSSLAVALSFGISIAWLVERTDLPGKTLVYGAMSLGLLLPNFFLAMGWLFMLHPRIGAVNRWLMDVLHLQQAPFSILSIWGMGWVEGLGLTALVFILTAASFRSMDPALEEAAVAHGATFGQTVRRVMLPLVRPAILGSALYVFTIAVASFDVPAIIGWSNRIYTFSTYVYVKSVSADALPEYGPTAAMSILIVAVAVGCSWWYGRVIGRANRYQVVTGKGYRPRPIALGRWTAAGWLLVGGYLVVGKLLPLLLIAWAAVLPFFQPPSLKALSTVSLANFEQIPLGLLGRGAWHTAVLMIAVPAAALLVSGCFSWAIVRSRSRWRGLLDFFAFLPHAVPSIIFGVGAVFVALFLLKGLQLYGSLVLLAIVYVVVRISFGTRLLNAALVQIHRELQEAAATCGAGALRTARSVIVPLLWPAVLNGWLWIALETYRELTMASVLYSPSNVTLPVMVWSIWLSGNLGIASAVSLLLLTCLAPLVILYWAIGRRQGPRARSAGTS